MCDVMNLFTYNFLFIFFKYCKTIKFILNKLLEQVIQVFFVVVVVVVSNRLENLLLKTVYYFYYLTIM